MLTEEKFSCLIEACDRLLGAPNAIPSRVSLDWLHVVSEHPVMLAPYQRVAQGISTRSMRDLTIEFGRLARVFAQATRRWRSHCFPKAAVDCLFVSHLLNEEQASAPDDFYFGDLPSWLSRHGVTSLVVLRNHSRVSDGALSPTVTHGGGLARFLLPRSDEIRVEVARMRATHQLRRDLRVVSRAVPAHMKIVAEAAAEWALSEATVANLRFAAHVRQLVRLTRPRAIFVTYEGRAWERLAFAAARDVDRAILCVGYQHTILRQRQHAMRRPLGSMFDPDVVLTTGDTPRDLLEDCAARMGARLVVYGSHRRAAQIKAPTPDAPARCLVLPEGIDTECIVLFDFALQCAGRYPEVEFVLRTHPVLPMRRLARQYSRFRRLPPNVVTSTAGSIDADFARCRWALYRGSSAAVHAVLGGLRPFYLGRPGELSIDPMYSLGSWRSVIASVEEFGDQAAADRRLENGERLREWETAKEWAERYMIPPRPEAVLALLMH